MLSAKKGSTIRILDGNDEFVKDIQTRAVWNNWTVIDERCKKKFAVINVSTLWKLVGLWFIMDIVCLWIGWPEDFTVRDVIYKQYWLGAFTAAAWWLSRRET